VKIAADLERDICVRLNSLSDKIDGEIGHNYGRHFFNGVFEMNDYYWGECTCGYADMEDEWVSGNFHRESCYQIDYYDLTKDSNRVFLSDGEIKKLCRKHDIPYNKGSGGSVHCTCDYERKWKDFISVYDHKLDCLLVLPNFRYNDFEITWYKYVGRGMEYNREISKGEIKEIFDYCEVSLCQTVPRLRCP
jgi:hypothetical protein